MNIKGTFSKFCVKAHDDISKLLMGINTKITIKNVDLQCNLCSSVCTFVLDLEQSVFLFEYVNSLIH